MVPLRYFIEEGEEGVFISLPGSKACGGPVSYLAYSLDVDTADFLSKVEDYKVATQNFNRKWNVASTCDVLPPPVDVVCENGKPVLVF